MSPHTEHNPLDLFSAEEGDVREVQGFRAVRISRERYAMYQLNLGQEVSYMWPELVIYHLHKPLGSPGFAMVECVICARAN